MLEIYLTDWDLQARGTGMSEQFAPWGIDFSECELPAHAAVLLDNFKEEKPGQFQRRTGTWQCPFLRDAWVVGLFKTGIVGTVSGPFAYMVTVDGVYPMHGFIRTVAENGSASFEASENSIFNYAAMLLKYLPGKDDFDLIQPRSVRHLIAKGIDAKSLIEVERINSAFRISAYVLDINSLVSRLTCRVSDSDGKVLSFDLEGTGVESVPIKGYM